MASCRLSNASNVLLVARMELEQQKQRAGLFIAGRWLFPEVLEFAGASLHHFTKQLFMEMLRFTG